MKKQRTVKLQLRSALGSRSVGLGVWLPGRMYPAGQHAGSGVFARPTGSPLWAARFHSAEFQASNKPGTGLPIQKLSWIPGTGVWEGVYCYFIGVWVGGLDFGRRLQEEQNNPE